MSKLVLLQTATLCSVVLCRLDVCFFDGGAKSCETLENFAALEEFVSTPRAKVEIHDRHLTKSHKFRFSRPLYAKELLIRHCGLAEIEPGAFDVNSAVLKLDLQWNELETIKNGVFNGLLLTHLNLGHNRLKTIEPSALSFMRNIEEVTLADNLLAEYDSRWFESTPLLKALHFENNSIEEVPRRAFSHLIDKTDLFFSFNRIKFIHPMAFDGMMNKTIGKIYLDHNLLRGWTEALSMNIDNLKISFNKIKCIHGNLSVTIKNNLENFIENPYDCDCLKMIKTFGDQRGDCSDWFRNQYLKCRGSSPRRNMIVFSSP